MAEEQKPVTPETPSTPSPSSDPVKMAEELGRLKKVEEDFKTYKSKADPIIETVWGDEDALKVVDTAYKKRMGITPEPKKPDENPDDKPKVPVTTSDPDTRKAVINQISDKFEDKAGISKLPDDKKKEVRGLVGQMLKEMLDPKGNKTIQEVFDEVSLTKLPWYMEKAYYLINRENDLSAATERGKQEVITQYAGDTGSIGSIPSSSIPAEQTTLTPKEKAVARNLNISEEEYLKQKKAIIEMRTTP